MTSEKANAENPKTVTSTHFSRVLILNPKMVHFPHSGHSNFRQKFKTVTFTHFLCLSSGTISERSDEQILRELTLKTLILGPKIFSVY